MKELVIESICLTKKYDNKSVVNRLKLEVPEGSVYAFVGPNGAGKTTTIRMMLGLIKSDEGWVRYFGEDFSPSKRWLLKNVGSLVEEPSLYPHLTGAENLEVDRRLLDLDKKNIDRVLNTVGLEKAGKKLVKKYSLGMRQRLGIAKALLSNPKILILDEPTNGLDPVGIKEVRNLLKELTSSQGVTVFISSHLLLEVEQTATHIGIIDNGRLRFQGSLEELNSMKGNYIRIGVDKPEKAVNVLKRAGCSVAIKKAKELLVTTCENENTATNLNKLLLESGIGVFKLESNKSNLEEVFMSITGKKRRLGQ